MYYPQKKIYKKLNAYRVPIALPNSWFDPSSNIAIENGNKFSFIFNHSEIASVDSGILNIAHLIKKGRKITGQLVKLTWLRFTLSDTQELIVWS